MFTDTYPIGEERYVLTSFDMSYLSYEVRGCGNAVGASPSVPVDTMIKERAGIPLNGETSTFIIGFDIDLPNNPLLESVISEPVLH